MENMSLKFWVETLEQGEEQNSELDRCKRNEWQVNEEPLGNHFRELGAYD